jgi:hypothetical protein
MADHRLPGQAWSAVFYQPLSRNCHISWATANPAHSQVLTTRHLMPPAEHRMHPPERCSEMITLERTDQHKHYQRADGHARLLPESVTRPRPVPLR